jgi:hypothetical protein
MREFSALPTLKGGQKTMSVYSLMAIPNRLAVSGEDPIVCRLETGSIGMALAFEI